MAMQKIQNETRQQNKQQNPSPNLSNLLLHQAQNARIMKFLNNVHLSQKISRTIKEISLLIYGKVSAAMTVEAALVLPLFLFFFMNLMSLGEMMRLHSKLQLAMWEAGNRLSVYGIVLDDDFLKTHTEEKTEGAKEEAGLLDVAFSHTYLKHEIVEYLGKEYLEQSPLTYGTSGLIFPESDLITDSGQIRIEMHYSVSPCFSVPGFASFLMANRYCCHLWTGYEIPGTKEEDAETKLYYVTEYGEVYHTRRECSYLKVSKEAVSKTDLYWRRSETGKKYAACKLCGKREFSGVCWITRSGECFHLTEDCPGLKRTVFTITEKELTGYRPCSKCGGG